MNTIASLLHNAAERIGDASESPRLDAEVLLVHVTGKARSHFLAWPEREINTEQSAEFRKLVDRRCQGEPIAYITGRREFWSREFLVIPDVLIPRPETELLVEVALGKAPFDQPVRILDLGTGSGVIGITLALERPLAQVTAVDISPAALAVAQANAERLGARNIRFLLSDWYEALDPGEKFDLLVSNPPYIAENDPHLAEGDVRFEPYSALKSGENGLDDLDRIAGAASKHAYRGAWLMLEHGFDQALAVGEILRAAGFTSSFSRFDLQGHHRVTGGQWC